MKVCSDVPDGWKDFHNFFEYSSISSSFFNINMPNSVKTYALDPFGESSRRIGFTSPSLMNSSIRRLTELLSPLAIFSSSIQVLGSLRARSMVYPLAFASEVRISSTDTIRNLVTGLILLFWVEIRKFVINLKISNELETFIYFCFRLVTKFGG